LGERKIEWLQTAGTLLNWPGRTLKRGAPPFVPKRILRQCGLEGNRLNLFGNSGFSIMIWPKI
jgi:hypothetical protein